MKVVNSTMTTVSYCEEMSEGKVVVNRDYQRSKKVWPAKARSYLIDTILLGYPVPKISLYQHTNLKTRKTIKEIVDGQQRSMAILDFYNDELRVSGNSKYSGLTFSQLDEEDQATFIEYQLSLDIFVGATDEEIRQVFRRINSYTVPLNKQELRHSTWQGDFKWFIVRLVEQYAQALKDIGTFNESQLNRMKDAALLTEIIAATEAGIVSASENKLDTFYKDHDDSFADEKLIKRLVDTSFSYVLEWPEIHGTALVKPYNLYVLMLGIMHHLHPFQSLQDVYKVDTPTALDAKASLVKLTELAEVLAEPDMAGNKYKEFIKANSEATNRIGQRKTRFKTLCAALVPE